MKITPVQRTNQNFKATITFNPGRISPDARPVLIDGISSLLKAPDKSVIAGMFSPEKTSARLRFEKGTETVMDTVIAFLSELTGVPFTFSLKDRTIKDTLRVLRSEGRHI